MDMPSRRVGWGHCKTTTSASTATGSVSAWRNATTRETSVQVPRAVGTTAATAARAKPFAET
eukprot:60225-Pyramimonas_sp.AAC.1